MIAAARRVAWWSVPLVGGAAAVAAFLPPAIGLALAAALVIGVAVLARPLWGVYALVLSVPVQRELVLAGHAIATQALMALLLFAWWGWMATRHRPIVVPLFAWALAAYLAVMAVSLLVATSVPLGLAEMGRWGVTLLTYVIIVNTVRTRVEVVGLVVCLLAGATAEGVLGLWQAATRQVPPSFYVGQGGDPEALAPRAFGTIGAPNSYAGYLNMTLALALAVGVYFLFTRVPPALRGWRTARPARAPWAASLAMTLLLLGATGVMFGGLVVSYSRGGLLGLALGLLGLVVILGRRAAPALIALAVGALLLGLLAWTGALPPSLQDRLASTVNQLQIYDVRGVEATPATFNQIQRLAHWQVAGNMYLADPWLGIGIGNYNLLFPRFAVPGWEVSQGQAHNYYLQALAETGLFGLAAYLLLLGVALVSGWRAARRALAARRGLESAVLVGAFGVVLTIVGHSVFEDLHVLNMGIHWVAVISLFHVVEV